MAMTMNGYDPASRAALERVARKTIANTVLEPGSSPMTMLGEIIAFANHFGTDNEKRFAVAVDSAVKAEYEKMKAEEGR